MAGATTIIIYFDDRIPFEHEALLGFEQSLRAVPDWHVWGLFGHDTIDRFIASDFTCDIFVAFAQEHALPQLPEGFASHVVLAYNCHADPPDVASLWRVQLDEYLCGYLAARHLDRAGYEALCCFNAPTVPKMSTRRIEGFKAYCAEQRRPYAVEWNDSDTMSLMQDIDRWLDQLPAGRIGAFACLDHIGNIMVKKALQRGIAIPEKLGVVGCGDFQKTRSMGRVPLSAVTIPWVEVGFSAMILAREAAAGRPPRDILLAPHGVAVRASTDPHATSDALSLKVYEDLHDNLAEIGTVAELAARHHISERQLARRIQEAFGCAPAELMARARIDRARNLLAHTDRTIDDIAAACGLSTPRALQKLFKRLTGMPPSRFRQR